MAMCEAAFLIWNIVEGVCQEPPRYPEYTVPKGCYEVKGSAYDAQTYTKRPYWMEYKCPGDEVITAANDLTQEFFDEYADTGLSAAMATIGKKGKRKDDDTKTVWPGIPPVPVVSDPVISTPAPVSLPSSLWLMLVALISTIFARKLK